MANIIDYAKKEKRVFAKERFNELDSAIFAQLAYCHFDNFPEINRIQDINIDEDVLLELTKKTLGEKDTRILLKALVKNPRFNQVRIIKTINRVDVENESQFSCVVFELENKVYYLSLRGTKATTIGWKENFNMAFQDIVPAQYFARKFFRKFSVKNPGKYIIGGHSKGGNLAFYLGASANSQDNKSIIRIDNFDGPGFHNQKNHIDHSLLKLMGKIHKFIPTGSLIGLLQDDLIENKKICRIVQASGFIPLQHNIFTWEIDENHFLYAPKLENPSQVSLQAIRSWLENLPDQERKDFIEMVFMAIQESGDTSIRQLMNLKDMKDIGSRLIKAKNTNPSLWSKVISYFLNAYKNAGKSVFDEKKDETSKKIKDIFDFKNESLTLKNKNSLK